MPLRDMDAMLGFGGHWRWFPTVDTALDSAEFKWRGDRVFLLEPDGSAVEGIVFAGARSDHRPHQRDHERAA